MTLYADSSALLKRYVDEADSARAVEMLASDSLLVTARHTVIEVRRNLARLLTGDDLTVARRDFHVDSEAFAIVELDAATCELAARSRNKRVSVRSPRCTSVPRGGSGSDSPSSPSTCGRRKPVALSASRSSAPDLRLRSR